MLISPLAASDAPEYRELMLEAYVRAGDAFTSTAEERALEPDSWWVKRIAHAQGLSAAFGARTGTELLGVVALEYSAKPKTKHSAMLIGMYVRGQARGKGVGKALLQAAIGHAEARPGTKCITLTVTEGNAHAIRLYEEAGFQAWGTEPMAIATPTGYKAKVHMWRAVAGGEAAA
jgi:ribosomal protein S18 acetylase RimI-like enzyme